MMRFEKLKKRHWIRTRIPGYREFSQKSLNVTKGEKFVKFVYSLTEQ